MTKRVKNIIGIFIIFFVSITIGIFTFYLAPSIKPVNECLDTITDFEGNNYDDLYKIRITEIRDKSKITKINYYPNEFLTPYKPMKNGKVVDLSKKNFHLAKRGTLQIVLLDPDPFSPTFKTDILPLKKFEKGNNWFFTLDLPPIFSACNVYAQNKNIANIGEIKDYDFIEFNDYDSTITTKHNSKTSPIYIDLNYYSKREALSPYITSNNLITIHYETENESISPIQEFPFIGSKDSIINIRSTMSKFYTFIATLSGSVFFLFLYISLIKKDKRPLPSLLLMLFISLIFCTKIILNTVTSIPIFWLILTDLFFSASVIAIIPSYISIKNNTPGKIILVLFTILFFMTTVLSPFLTYDIYNILHIIINIIQLLIILFSIIKIFISIIKDTDKIYNYSAILIVCIAFTVHFFITITKFNISTLFFSYFILLSSIIITFIFCLKLFLATEKRNINLTLNLQTEVDIRTKEITRALSERNKMLQYISHDLRKPMNFYTNSLNKIKATEHNEENIKLINELIMKTKETDEGLKKVAEFSRINFLSEPLEVIDLKKFIEDIYMSTKPDCDASGVILQNNVCKSYNVYAKKQGLTSALLNIVFNALEHAECTKITIDIKMKNNNVIIIINDNGKGVKVEEGKDIFMPYVTSQSNNGNNGLGLYICKEALNSMNGDITYSSEKGNTNFYISLPTYYNN